MFINEKKRSIKFFGRDHFLNYKKNESTLFALINLETV